MTRYLNPEQRSHRHRPRHRLCAVYAFVEMGSDADAQACIEALDGSELDGRNIKVNEAKERKKRGGGGRDRW